MKATDKDLNYDRLLIHKLDLMIERCTKRKFDNLLIVEGDEGYGKTNMAALIAYYVSFKTGRQLSLDNVFFDAEEMVNFAKSTQDQIIWLYEAAIAGLASELQNKIQKKLIKMLMIARKKRHFYIICIPKFYKLNEYIIGRSIGMVRVYAKNETVLGRFVYYNKSCIRNLYNLWRTKKRLEYHKYCIFHGTFANVLGKIMDEDAYDEKKDAAILKALTDEENNKSVEKVQLHGLKYGIACLIKRMKEIPQINHEEALKILGTSYDTVRKWIVYGKNKQVPLENEPILAQEGGNIS